MSEFIIRPGQINLLLHGFTGSARIRQVTIGGLALINKHKSGCMMNKETNIRAHYVILYDVIIYQHA